MPKKSNRQERIRRVLEKFSYRGSRYTVGDGKGPERHLQPHHVEALTPLIERLVKNEIERSRKAARSFWS